MLDDLPHHQGACEGSLPVTLQCCRCGKSTYAAVRSGRKKPRPELRKKQKHESGFLQSGHAMPLYWEEAIARLVASVC